ncbi:MAG: hypothetical protein Q7T01_03010 [bacterium]|nr:hypothetical protein [bacterium]
MRSPAPGMVCYPKSMATAAAWFGWTGAAMFLLAYTLAIFGVINATALSYAILNGLGALGVIIEAVVHRTKPVLFLNVAWLGIAIAALFRNL